MGWAALQFPWKDKLLTPELKVIVTSTDLPPTAEGANMEIYPLFFECLTFADQNGYDPENHYRKLYSLIFHFSNISLKLREVP